MRKMHGLMMMEKNIAGLRNGDFSDKKWQEIYNRYFKSEDDKSTLNKILKAAFFKENKSSISKKVAKSLYPENLRGSTSQLERYAACAFSFRRDRNTVLKHMI